jgi:hypothetical protein
MITPQQKREAWAKAGKLCTEAAILLIDVDEGPMEQAQLLHIQEKAFVQIRLWLDSITVRDFIQRES